MNNSEKKNQGEILFIWSRVGDPSDAFLRLYSRIFTDILGEQDSSPSEEDDHTEGGQESGAKERDG